MLDCAGCNEGNVEVDAVVGEEVGLDVGLVEEVGELGKEGLFGVLLACLELIDGEGEASQPEAVYDADAGDEVAFVGE